MSVLGATARVRGKKKKTKLRSWFFCFPGIADSGHRDRGISPIPEFRRSPKHRGLAVTSHQSFTVWRTPRTKNVAAWSSRIWDVEAAGSDSRSSPKSSGLPQGRGFEYAEHLRAAHAGPIQSPASRSRSGSRAGARGFRRMRRAAEMTHRPGRGGGPFSPLLSLLCTRLRKPVGPSFCC